MYPLKLWFQTLKHDIHNNTQFHIEIVYDTVVVVVALREIHDMRTVFETTTETDTHTHIVQHY